MRLVGVFSFTDCLQTAVQGFGGFSPSIEPNPWADAPYAAASGNHSPVELEHCQDNNASVIRNKMHRPGFGALIRWFTRFGGLKPRYWVARQFGSDSVTRLVKRSQHPTNQVGFDLFGDGQGRVSLFNWHGETWVILTVPKRQKPQKGLRIRNSKSGLHQTTFGHAQDFTRRDNQVIQHPHINQRQGLLQGLSQHFIGT